MYSYVFMSGEAFGNVH